MTSVRKRSSRTHRRQKSAPARPKFITNRFTALVAAMLAACLILGGGGTTNPATEVVLELTLPLFALLAIWLPGQSGPQPGVPRTALAIAVLALIIPVAQLVPLPPTLWHSFPGRQPEIDSLTLIGQAQRWMPWSMTPARTFAALLAILAELALFVSAARLDQSGRARLCMVIAAVAVASLMLGSLQLSQAGGFSWSVYDVPSDGWLLGFHANRNAATDTLQIGILALAALMAGAAQRGQSRGMALLVPVLVMIALALGAVLTGSRAGIALLPLTYLFVVWILWPLITRRASYTWGLAMLIPPAVCAALATTAPVQHAFSRFSDMGDHRWEIWHDTVHAVATVWPAGSGISSFQVVYDASQSIERLIPEIDARAHNDWLEWSLEAGLPGLVVLALIGTILLTCNIAALRRVLRSGASPDTRAQVLFATGTLLHLGLHGLLDYPMRSMALAALAATAAALLMPLRQPDRASE